jgi:hypothetical protein
VLTLIRAARQRVSVLPQPPPQIVFFNVRGGKGFPDAEGVEFADASAAFGEAVTLAGEMLRRQDGHRA